MKLFFDFDGTIIDVSEKYYKVYCHCLDKNTKPVSKDEYWKLKQERTPEKDILEKFHPEVDIDEYIKRRLLLIERPDYLAYDEMITNVHRALIRLSRGHELYLVTLRQCHKNLVEEFERFRLQPLFVKVFSCPPSSTPWKDKAQLIKAVVDPSSWIIGDTEADIKGGQLLNITTCAVLSGIRTSQFLRSLQPDYMIKTISELVELICLRD